MNEEMDLLPWWALSLRPIDHLVFANHLTRFRSDFAAGVLRSFGCHRGARCCVTFDAPAR
jgi:hypothetical protein